jgi:dienelactone hydrolase
VLEQNEDPSSKLFHRIDTTHIGATGHSQGAMATAQASGDSHITTSIPIEGASAQRNLRGPAMFFCGGLDDIVGCTGAQSALAAVTTLPAMYAELIGVDHGSWMSRGSTLSVSDTAFTAWMRVHLMGDTALRSWFYGDSCKLCTDTAWNIDRKNMDQ